MQSPWVRRWLLAALVVFVVVGAAAPETLKAAKLAWPPWAVAAVAGAITALSGLVKPISDTYMQAWAKKPARSAELAQRRADLIKSVSGSGRNLPHVRDITDRALLRIHPSIPLPSEHQAELSPDLPEYVPRDVDADLRTWLSSRRHIGGLMLVVGPAAAGKTRSAHQALLDVVDDWRLFLPTTGAEVVEWATSGADPSKTVVWLDDIDRFLGGQGLTVTTVRRLLADQNRPVLLVGTIWPDRLEILTQPSNSDDIDNQGLGRDAREVLDKWPTRFDLTPAFSSTEQDRARQIAERDPRLAEAIRVPDGAHIAQTLAAAPELIRRWLNPSNRYGAAVITAAVTARRCGHAEPLPAKLLEPLAEDALAPQDRAVATPEWFNHGLDWARDLVRGQAAPLTPYGSTIGVTDGDRVSDVLVQYATTNFDKPEHSVAINSWQLVIEYSAPDACNAIGLTAYSETDQVDLAEQAFRKGAEAGHAESTYNLGGLLRVLGRLDEAETWVRRAVELDHAMAMNLLGDLLMQDGRIDEGETWYRRAANTGDTDAMYNFGVFLKGEDRGDEAETWYRRAAEVGDTDAMVGLGGLLTEKDRGDEAETWYRRAAKTGDSGAIHNVGVLLIRSGRADEAEEWHRRWAESKVSGSMFTLAILLRKNGQDDEAEAWLRKSAEANNIEAIGSLGSLLMENGQDDEAEAWLRKSAEASDAKGMFLLGSLLLKQERDNEAETWLHRAAEHGDSTMMHLFGVFLAINERADEAVNWYRRAADNGNTEAMHSLGASLLGYQRKDGIIISATGLNDVSEQRLCEAKSWLLRAAEAEQVEAMVTLGLLFEVTRRADKAVHWYRRAADAGNTQAASFLLRLETEEARVDETNPRTRPAPTEES